MKSKRYIIEGTWSGYTAAQSRIMHREVTICEKRAEWSKNAGLILFTDNTSLYLNVREAKPYERDKAMKSYSKLINQCIRENCSIVARLKD